MATLTVYLVEQEGDSACYNFIATTQKGIKSKIVGWNIDNITHVSKVSIEYNSGFELVEWFTAEGNSRTKGSFEDVLEEYCVEAFKKDLKFKKI